MLLAIERAVVERLGRTLAPLPVEALPSHGYRFGHAKGSAVVALTEVSASGVEDVGASVQRAQATLEVVLFARSLRDGAGVWDLFGAARRALLSWTPVPGATPLRVLSARLQDGEADTWILVTRWQTIVPLAPDLDDASGPRVTRVTWTGTD
jgi:hypothetical protein